MRFSKLGLYESVQVAWKREGKRLLSLDFYIWNRVSIYVKAFSMSLAGRSISGSRLSGCLARATEQLIAFWSFDRGHLTLGDPIPQLTRGTSRSRERIFWLFHRNPRATNSLSACLLLASYLRKELHQKALQHLRFYLHLLRIAHLATISAAPCFESEVLEELGHLLRRLVNDLNPPFLPQFAATQGLIEVYLMQYQSGFLDGILVETQQLVSHFGQQHYPVSLPKLMRDWLHRTSLLL